MCEWDRYEEERSELLSLVDAGAPASVPFTLLAVPATLRQQQVCAERFVEETLGPAARAAQSPIVRARQGQRNRKIRLAYVSADYGDHPVANLMAGVFEHHDRSRFEITAIALSPDPVRPAAARERIRSAADRFLVVNDKNDSELVELMRAEEFDIAVDLNGLTAGVRLGIFAARIAPVQVTYLGCGGTSGARFFDYLIGDPVAVPADEEEFYTEHIVKLPDSLQPNDAQRVISPIAQARADHGLPEAGFVFCAFNNAYKFTPAMFDLWMRLLAQVDGSVLWLLDGNRWATQNLKKEATARGIAPERLVFAPRLPNADHLARCRLADLFLDTLPCNGGATTSDALWAGLPVLTCPGHGLAGRMSASLLHAVGMPELVTGSLAEYEQLALRLARNPDQIAAVKAKLARNKTISPLFDTARCTRHLEKAYALMCERAERGEPPQGFTVEAVDSPPERRDEN